MACPTPPPAIVISIQVAAPSPLDLTFTSTSNAAKLKVSEDGDLHFRKFRCAISVKMQFTDGNTFYKGGTQDALSYANDPDALNYSPVTWGSGQFTSYTRSADNKTITFTYYNGDGCKQYKYSGYGVYAADANNNPLGEYDPIVSNGGNGDNFHVCGAGPARRRAHHRSR
jgi:hypothetical protein